MTMEDAIFKVIWHGTGLLCIGLLYLLIKRLIVILRGKGRRKIFLVILVGLMSGVAGLLLFTLYLGSSYNKWFDYLSFNERGIATVVIYYFSTLICGLPIDLLISNRKYSPQRSILYVTLCFASLVLAYPIAFGWLRRLAGIFILA